MNSSLSARDLAHVWHPYSPLSERAPVEISHASGELLFTTDGREIVDMISSWWVNLHGHCHPHIQQAVAAQLARLDHVIFAGFTHEPAVALAEGLLRHLPEEQERIFFSDNGSTAVEVAIKLALQYWSNQGESRNRIAVLDGSYHGDTVGAMSVSQRDIFTRAFRDLLFDVIVLPRPEGDGSVFLDAVEKCASDKSLAAFIYEPLVQGASGMYMYDPAILDRALQRLKEPGVVCIADEVMTGFGRTGRWFASDYMENKPDLITLSKGITGGVLPLGVTSCHRRIADVFRSEEKARSFFHGHSYTANPVACSAALASLELLERPAAWERIRSIEALHRDACARFAADSRIANARCTGTILALTIKDPQPGYLSPLAGQLYEFFLSHNFLIRPLGNIVYLMPPYCISEDRLKSAYQLISRALEMM